MPYLFGDSDLAARRLYVLAEVYAASTQAFLRDAVRYAPRAAVDLGCGPGYSTHLLAQTLPCERLTGLENSPHFLALAQQTATARVTFAQHDATLVPFPVTDSDLVFSRLLLTHLQDPQPILVRWATQLQPRGLLLVEEVEWIHTQNPLFTQYLGIVQALQETRANHPYLGPLLEQLPNLPRLQRRFSRVSPVPVASRQAATMFFLNMQSWRQQPFIQATYPPAMLDRMADALHQVMQEGHDTSDITWGMRQLAYARI